MQGEGQEPIDAILKHVRVGAGRVDRAGRLRYANECLAARAARPSAQLLNLPLQEALGHAQLASCIAQAMAGMAAGSGEMAAIPHRAAGGEVVGALFFIDDAAQGAACSPLWENDLPAAVARNELRLHYQPVVNGQQRIVGMEALLRWPHPVFGLVPPTDFIALAERNGLILPIGWWVLETACAQLAQWQRQAHSAHWVLGVNISVRQFGEPGFVSRVLELLRRSGANPHQLCLELTETLLLTGIDQCFLAQLAQLGEQGVRLALDDFGVGYSSLSYLSQLPLNILKIDRSFVHGMLDKSKDRSIALAVLSLGRALGLEVVAEGVETPEQFEFLRAAGCSTFQGYLFRRPEASEYFMGEND